VTSFQRKEEISMKSRFLKSIAAAALLALGLITQQSDVAAASLAARIEVKVTGTYVSAAGLVTGTAPLSQSYVQDLANGVGANQGNVLYTATRSVLTAATDSLDLVGGGLTDAYGAAIAPARIRAVLIRSASGNTTNLTLFGDANSVPILNTAATTSTLKPGGVFLFTAPDATGVVVTAGTGDIIKVVNAAGATALYDIIVIGASS
jgi:hypothetical protein